MYFCAGCSYSILNKSRCFEYFVICISLTCCSCDFHNSKTTTSWSCLFSAEECITLGHCIEIIDFHTGAESSMIQRTSQANKRARANLSLGSFCLELCYKYSHLKQIQGKIKLSTKCDKYSCKTGFTFVLI